MSTATKAQARLARPEDPWADFWPKPIRQAVTNSESPTGQVWGGRLPTVASLGTLLSKQLPPATPRISPWLHSGESCLLWGGTGTGKSMVSMTLALAVAGGGKVFGWDFPNPCNVLYLDGEQNERTLKSRFALLAQTIDGFNPDLASLNLGYSPRTSHLTGGKFFDIGAGEHTGDIVEALRASDVGFVVFDNLSTLTDGLEEENAAAQFKKMQALLAHLKGANIAAILVHHAGKGKNPDTYRGSSNIATTFERVLGLIHDDKESPTKLAVTVRLDKYRDKPPEGFQPEFPLSLEEEEATEGKRLKWKLGDLHELREGWRMFAYGEYRSNGEFLKAYNKKFGTTYTKGNFAMQFTQRWQLKLGIAESEIRRAKTRMTERRNGNLEMDTSDDF